MYLKKSVRNRNEQRREDFHGFSNADFRDGKCCTKNKHENEPDEAEMEFDAMECPIAVQV